MSQFNMPPGVSTRDIPTGDECEGCSDRDEVIAELLSACERLTTNFEALLARKPVRDATETIAEAHAAIARAKP